MTFGKTHASHASSSVDTAAFKLECRHSTLSEDTAEFVHPEDYDVDMTSFSSTGVSLLCFFCRPKAALGQWKK